MSFCVEFVKNIDLFTVSTSLSTQAVDNSGACTHTPAEHNDCIFAVVCEELGLIGACVVMLLFALLILRGFWIALHAKDRFGTLMVVGIMTLISLQTFLNIAVVTGLIPATGISLPFFSYGGTALALQLFEMGIVLSVSRQIPAPRNG